MYTTIGLIEDVNPGDYSVLVKAGDKDIICSLAFSALSNIYGLSYAGVPTPGSKAVVFVPEEDDNYGYILGIIPYDGIRVGQDQISMNLLSGNNQSDDTTEFGFKITNAEDTFLLNSNSNRPRDVLLGEQAELNKFGIGSYKTLLTTGLKASPMAKIEFSLLDDKVTVVSGFYEHTSAIGSHKIFNDGGRLTEETEITPHQTELFGQTDLNQETINNGHEVLDSNYLRSRMKIFMGYLGNLLNVFVSSPHDKGPKKYGDMKLEDGLAHLHIGNDGTLMARSASDIIIERTDLIPIPRRSREPWDPKGYKQEDDDSYPRNQEEDEISDERLEPLGLRDRLALKVKNAYRTIRRLVNKDFHLDQESTTSIPYDEYDEISGSRDRKQKYQKRSAGIYLTKDGRIHLRSAWGSEIIVGDNIEIIGANNITTRAGKHVINMAGGDLIWKAHDDIAISSTEGRIQLKAETNIEAISNTGNVFFITKGELTQDEIDAGIDDKKSRIDFLTDTFAVGSNHLLLEEKLGRWIPGSRYVTKHNRYERAISTDIPDNEIKFEFKNSEDYGDYNLMESGLKMLEPHWCSQLRQGNELLKNVSVKDWIEKPVTNAGAMTYPFPGYDYYNESTYVKVEESNWSDYATIEDVDESGDLNTRINTTDYVFSKYEIRDD